MLERFVTKALAMKRYAPYAAAFVLGVGSLWGVSNFVGTGATGSAPVNVAMDHQRPASTVTKRRARAVAATRQAASASAGKQARLLRAAGKGDIGTVRRLLAARIEVDTVDEQGRTPLIRAIENGENAVAELLIERRANVNVATDDGETALTIAARRGDPVATHLLIENGARLGRRNSDGLTAKAIAKRNGHDVVHELIADAGGRRAAVRKRVATAQHLLANLGYRPGKADGQYGRRTRKAIKRFQRDNRVATTGEITPRLIIALKRARTKARAARRATRRTTVAATGGTPRLKQPRTASGADSAEQEDGMWNRTKGWFGKATSSVGSLFNSDDDTQTARSEDGEKKGWVGDSTSKVGGFFKSQRDQHEALRRQCEDSGESWIKDQSSGAWIDCSQYM